MRRDLGAFDRPFDLLVVGGGIYGACIARLAALSGWSVGLVEREDFGGQVSHNSLKIVHGGFRYLQHFDVPRIRESIAAQRAWLRAAPHLIRPMRCVIPAYGYGTRGPLAFAAGAFAFAVLGAGRNTGLQPGSRLPNPGVMSRRALLSRYPELDRADLTGGAWWYDAQMLDPNRLTLECLDDACRHDAVVANHLEAVALLRSAARIEGAVVRDRLTGREIEIRARVTVNATGASVERLLGLGTADLGFERPLVWTRNVNVVTRRRVFATQDAVGVGSQRASDAVIGKSKRLFFVTVWRDCTILGTSHIQHAGDPETLAPAVANDVAGFLEEINEALPRLDLRREDLCYVHSGLTPAEDDVERVKRSVVIDHAERGVAGLVTVLGIKYTTAPTVAGRVVAAVARALGAPAPAERGAFAAPLPGNPLAHGARADIRQPRMGPVESEADWARHVYGARAGELLGALPRSGLTEEEHVFRCRVLYGIEREMVMCLRDAVFRASDAAERGLLSADRLAWCAETLASRLSWSATRRDAEVAAVRARLDAC